MCGTGRMWHSVLMRCRDEKEVFRVMKHKYEIVVIALS